MNLALLALNADSVLTTSDCDGIVEELRYINYTLSHAYLDTDKLMEEYIHSIKSE